MRLAYLALILTAIVGPSRAQNATTTIITTVPVSTVSRTVSTVSASPSISLSTVFSVQTIVTSIPTPTASSAPDPNALNAKISPAFGVLGGLLILTGLPSAFWGHKNRWSSFFIVGFYTLAIVCMSLIIRYGVLEAVDPPSETLQGLFVLSCVVAGIIGGGFAIFFWKGTKYFIGAWGGFAIGLFIQCMHDDGLIEPLGFRYFLYIGCSVIGFVICTLPKLHYQILLAATAVVGASAFILGVDCFTRAGLKEFYVYNLGFNDLFPQFANKPFRVTQTMQIELGMMGAVTIMGMAVQARVLMALQARLREINAEQERRNAEVEAKAALQFRQRDEELAQWELEHGQGARNQYPPRSDDLEANGTPTPRASSQFSMFKSSSKEKGRSSVTMAEISTPPLSNSKDERSDTPALTLDLGESVGQKIPGSFLTPGTLQSGQPENTDPTLRRSVELLTEIRGIRDAINAIKQERPTSLLGTGTLETAKSTDGRPTNFSARPRGASVGTPLEGVNTVGTGLRNHTSNSTQRGYSAPMFTEWDEYVKSRSLFQPPSGVTQPVVPTKVEPRLHSISVPQAVTQAVEQRLKQERAYVEGGPQAYLEAGSSGSRPGSALFGSFSNGDTKSGESLPLADRRRTHSDSKSLAQFQARPGSQGYVLPPRPSLAHAPDRPVVKTFEELSARHKEKMKALQDPLSKQTAEEAEIAAARSRWERSLATEKNVMSRKEQEPSRKDQPRRGSDARRPHARSSSAFALHSSAEASRLPTSTAKVQDWQRHQDATQQQQRSSHVDGRAPGQSRSKSPLPLSGGR